MVGDQRNTAEFGYQRTISPNKIGKILSQMNHLTKMALGESSGVEIQARLTESRARSTLIALFPEDGRLPAFDRF